MPSTDAAKSTLYRRNVAAVEYCGNLLDRHNGGSSENDIRAAWRDFVLHTGIVADQKDIATETPPGEGVVRRVDLRVRNTYVEFKTSIMVNGQVDSAYVAQLDGYLLAAVQSGWGIQNGLLTDGKHCLKRNIGEAILPAAVAHNAPRVFDRPEQGPQLREYLNDIIDTDATGIVPSAETLTRHLGIDSDLLKQVTGLLLDSHARHRDNPTVAVKRRLWADLLRVALGQDALGDPDEADWLFIRHTYLTTLISLIVQASYGIDVKYQAEVYPDGLLNGSILRASAGLVDVVESEPFRWPSEIGDRAYLSALAGKVMQFNWSDPTGELPSILYRNTIAAEERRRMGECGTPRWLAQAMVKELVPDPLDTVAMDPACGSGAFIDCLCRNFIDAAAAKGFPAVTTLMYLRVSVVGIDLHPVAVQLAKAAWALSCHDLIARARQDGYGGLTGPQVYLGDSMQLRHDRSALSSAGFITLRTGEWLEGESEPAQFRVPMPLARYDPLLGDLMHNLAVTIEQGQDTNLTLDWHGITPGAQMDAMRQTAEWMRKLHAARRDHVWAYCLRNMVCPATFAEEKVDVIVGNPPWWRHSDSADIVRDELRNLGERTYGIWAGGEDAPHQDVATLFFCRAVDLYLKDGGRIGMALPHSALRAGPHSKWRSGCWGDGAGGVSVDFGIKTPWNLGNLEPNDFLPAPAGVVFAARNRVAKPLAPGLVEIWRGPAGTDEVTRQVEALHCDDGLSHK